MSKFAKGAESTNKETVVEVVAEATPSEKSLDEYQKVLESVAPEIQLAALKAAARLADRESAKAAKKAAREDKKAARAADRILRKEERDAKREMRLAEKAVKKAERAAEKAALSAKKADVSAALRAEAVSEAHKRLEALK